MKGDSGIPVLTHQAVPDVVFPRWNILGDSGNGHPGGEDRAHALAQGTVWDVG